MLSWKVRLEEREREREKTRKMMKNAAKFSRDVRIHVIFPLKGTRHLFRKFQRIIKLPEYLNSNTYISFCIFSFFFLFSL